MYSFDVFDTLITRTTKSPQGIFYIMQERILAMELEDGGFWRKNFAQIRINAEKNASAYYNATGKKCSDVDLDVIYQVVMQMTGISAGIASKLMGMEIQTEIDCAVGIVKNISRLKMLLEAKEHVVLISDMYLSSKIIKKILFSVDPVFDKIPLYVSNECGCTKSTGELFLYVKEKEKVLVKQWTHYGDNEKSDIKNAQKLGINAVWLKREELLPWEVEFDRRCCLETNAYWQIYAGTARTLRQSVEMNSYEKMGASFVGMILYPYVEWVVRSSLKKEISVLYFVARDGYILKKVADIIVDKYGFKLKTKYIYGSREAWRIRDADEQKKQMLRLYLKQEIDFSENFAFVEVNGTGYTMECLADFVNEICGKKSYVFYFSLKRRTEHSNCIFFTYLTAYDEIVEVMCRAPHGPTLGYRNEKQVIFPELQAVEDKIWGKAGMHEYIHGVKLYADNLASVLLKLDFNSDNRYLASQMLDYIRRSPNRQILCFLANMPHNNGYLDEQSVYAPVLSKKDIFRIYMWRINEPMSDFYKGVNIQYSELLCTDKEKKLIEFYKRNYYRLFGCIVHQYKGWILWHKSGCKVQRKKVIVYGAGTVGKKIYHCLVGDTKYKVTAWIDRDFLSYRRHGYPVSGLKHINKKFDIFVIAIKDIQTVQDIKKGLVEKGIAEEKILDMDSFWQLWNEGRDWR